MPSFDYASGQVFFRDSFVPFTAANVSIASSPVLYGLSVYTVFSVNWNDAEKKHYIFRLKDHYKRLVNSAAIMDFNTWAAAWPYEKFEATMRELITRNAAAIAGEDVLVRATVFVDALIAGTKMHDLPHVLAAYIYPAGQILPRGGVNMCVSSWMRNPDNAIPARAKVNGGYVNSSLMKNEAILNGYDDAIALDAQGHVTEATVANIFIVRNGVLVTPGVSADLLEGITRASVLTIARATGIPVEERSVDRSELYIADEAFLCGSSARLIPILSVDKRGVGAGAFGPITKTLLEKYEAAQRGTDDGAYKEWRMEI
jgi:branched-chain amino acid aminotransferase